MWRTLSLILPVLVPSWRFFRAVDPSPRVEWRRPGETWQAYRPRPARVGPGSMLLRLVWNPEWNDDLFVVSCAERIEQGPDPVAAREIARRMPQGCGVQFRLVFVHDDGTQVTQEVVHTSAPAP